MINQTEKLHSKAMPSLVSPWVSLISNLNAGLHGTIFARGHFFQVSLLSIQHFSAVVTCMLATIAPCKSAKTSKTQLRSVLNLCQFSYQRLVMIMSTSATESVLDFDDDAQMKNPKRSKTQLSGSATNSKQWLPRLRGLCTTLICRVQL